jgi:hypothetical protein
MHGRRRHGKRRLHQPRGHLTTRRQMPTASTNAYRRAGDSCMAGTLVFRGRLLEFSPSALRRSGAGGREERSLALVAKVAVMQLCSYDESPTRRFSAMSLSRRSPFKECHAHTHVLCLCLSLGVSLFPQTSLAIGLSLTPRNVRVWLAEQEESIAN